MNKGSDHNHLPFVTVCRKDFEKPKEELLLRQWSDKSKGGVKVKITSQKRPSLVFEIVKIWERSSIFILVTVTFILVTVTLQ